jgi:hypothetical protein
MNGEILKLSEAELTSIARIYAEKYSRNVILNNLEFYEEFDNNLRPDRYVDLNGIEITSRTTARELASLMADIVNDRTDDKIDELTYFVMADLSILMQIILWKAFEMLGGMSERSKQEFRTYMEEYNEPPNRGSNFYDRTMEEIGSVTHQLLFDYIGLVNQIEIPNFTATNLFDDDGAGYPVGGAVQVHRRAQVAEQNRRQNLSEGERRLEDESNLPKFDKLYDSILDEANFAQNDINRQLLKKKLNVKPLKSKFMVYEDGFMWQADTKVFGRDVISNGEVAILVCVDTSTRRCDAEPMFNIAQMDAVPAFTTILNRHIIQPGFPRLLKTDQGGEFGQVFTRFVNRLGIKHRLSFAGRKEQTSIAEHTIGLITFGLMANLYRMRVQNRSGNQRPRDITSVDFLSNGILPRIILKINAWASSHYPKPTKQWFNLDLGESETDLKEGDLVLVKNIKTERIRKRYGQHDYANQPYQIIKIYTPTIKGEPFRFLTTYSQGKPPVTFKRDELVKYTQNITPIIEFS